MGNKHKNWYQIHTKKGNLISWKNYYRFLNALLRITIQIFMGVIRGLICINNQKGRKLILNIFDSWQIHTVRAYVWGKADKAACPPPPSDKFRSPWRKISSFCGFLNVYSFELQIVIFKPKIVILKKMLFLNQKLSFLNQKLSFLNQNCHF